MTRFNVTDELLNMSFNKDRILIKKIVSQIVRGQRGLVTMKIKKKSV